MKCSRCDRKADKRYLGDYYEALCDRCHYADELSKLSSQFDFSGKPKRKFLQFKPVFKDGDLILGDPVDNRPGTIKADWDAELKKLPKRA